MARHPLTVHLPEAASEACAKKPAGHWTCCDPSQAGLLLAFGSGFFGATCLLLIQLLDHFDPAELAAFRFVGFFVPSLVAALRSGHDLFPAGRRCLLLLRALLGTAGIVFKFYALRHMSLADASVILVSVPVFVAMFARCFLREPCGWLHVATIGVTMVGMVLIVRPPVLFGTDASQTDVSILGAALALTGALLIASKYVVVRMLKGVPPTVIMTCFSGVATPLVLGLCLAVAQLKIPRSLPEAAMLLTFVAASFLSQLCLTCASLAEEAGPVAIVRSVCGAVFAVCWQFVLFAEVPGPLTATGMGLVIASVVLVGLRKWVASQNEESSVRQRLSWLM
ncbi:solute carrier family 35 member G1-like [Pollicipes pollicipes]|uniref:solute carrier family 35 member G1-like n=1 Tax=Pollicipes pollicipes TaxID=41117 RepID=UPI0018854607|nr:solute carrier family 35 member G1-like [Pollicipes pollicipes]